MKTTFLAKTNLKTHFKTTAKAILGFSLLSLAANATATAFDNYTVPTLNIEPVTCENGKNYADIFHDVQPFVDINYEAAIAKLPTEEANKLLMIENKINSLEKQLDSVNEIDTKQEIALIQLTEQAADIIEKHDIQFEEVNRLDSLTDEKKEQVIQQWCEIAQKIEEQNQRETEIGALFIQLDNMLLAKNPN